MRVLVSIASFVLACTLVYGGDRKALLIANWEYDKHPIPFVKPVADQVGMALVEAGFEVTRLNNVSKTFRQDIESFVRTVPTGGICLFYFAGYGSAYDKKVGRTVVKEDGSKEKVYDYESSNAIWGTEGDRSFDLDDLARPIRERSPARLNLIFLDCAQACPLPKCTAPLGVLDPGKFSGSLICCAMPPGRVLPPGEPSTLASALAEGLALKDLPLGELLGEVAERASKLTAGKQTLWHRFGMERDRRMTVVPTNPVPIATSKQPPKNPRSGDEWINHTGMRFCWCPPGSFTMGLADASMPDTRDAKQVSVTISKGFWMSKYETTLADYRRVRGRDPSVRSEFRQGNRPIHTFSAWSARDFGPKLLGKFEEKAGSLPSGWEYRLPTEAEWEYACRAGSELEFGFSPRGRGLDRYGNFADGALHREDESFHWADLESNDGAGAGPAPVGGYLPNAWGLHDMHGNVSESVIGDYEPVLKGGRDPIFKAEKDSLAIFRGGAWCSSSSNCRSGFRQSISPKEGPEFLGFRMILAPKK